MGHRRFLSKKHPYREMDCQFNGEKEHRAAPLHVTGDLILLQVKDIKTIEELPKMTEKILGKRKKRDGEEEEDGKGIWNKKSILWELEYWELLDVRHSIDNMHVKKNVCESICGTLLQQKLKGKDHKNAREDLKDMGIRPELYAEETDTGTDLPVAATTLSKTERKEFCEFLHGLKVPSGYSSNFKRLVSVKDMKMNFNLMKSHDCHVLMTALLPVALRGIKTVQVRDAVTSLCLFFNAIEQKVIDEEELLKLERRHFETLCMLEATFPPTFFDLMIHLTAHLAREIWFLGPSYLHQMFPYERYFGFLKSLVHNRSFPEGAMVRGYGTIEAVEWAMGYMDPQNPIGVPHSRHEGRLAGVGTMGKKSITPDPDAFNKAHFTVIQQIDLITPFANEHNQQLREENPARSEAWVAKKHMQCFSWWLRDYVQRCSAAVTDNLITKLAVGPLFTVTTYQAMDINGYTFYTMAQDAKSVYQNSGVRVRAVDNDMQAATYYGQIEEIWELDYVGFKVALFRCRWVNGKRGVSKDKYGFVSVDLRVFGYKDEPFVFAKDVEQVFYVPDLARKNWCVVMPGKKRIVGIANVVEEEEYNQFDEIPSFDTSYMPRLVATDKTPYLRTDHHEKIHIQKSKKKPSE
jgi:hypothetical protein